MTEIFIPVCGWTGTVLVVWAYYLVSNQKIDSSGTAYQLMNLIGSIGVGVNVFYLKAWPAVVLEVVWGAIAIVTLMKGKHRS